MSALLLFCLSSLCFATSSKTGDGREFNTPRTQFGPDSFSLNGTIAIPNPSLLCNPANNAEDLRGKIVLVDPDFCIASEKAWNAQEAGASGVILIEYRSTRGLLYYNLGGEHDNEIKIPTVEIALDDSKDLDGMNITLVPGENLFLKIGEVSWFLYSVIFAVWDVVIIAWASAKLYLFVQAAKKTYFPPTMPLFVLSTIIFAGLLRIPLLFDPNGSRRILSWKLVELFLTIDFSFNIISIYAIAFYSDAVTRIKSTTFELNSKFKWFGYGICVILGIVEIIKSVLRGLLMPAKPFLYGTMLLYVVSSLVVAIYFIWTRIKLLNAISATDKRRRRLYAGFLLAVCLFLFVFTALTIPTPLYTKPATFYWVRVLCNIWFYGAASLQIYMFVPKIQDGDRSKTEGSSVQMGSRISGAQEDDSDSSDDSDSDDSSE